MFLFLESTQNAVLHQRVLTKSSLKWRPWILINWCSLSVVVHDLENHFRCNGSNFLSYRLLHSFQSLSCLSKVWYPTVNRFLSGTASRRPSAKRMRNARCVATGDPPFFYKLLNNKGTMFSQPRHGIHWKRHVQRYSTTCSPPLYAIPTRSYDPPKSRCSFCRTLYFTNVAVSRVWSCYEHLLTCKRVELSYLTAHFIPFRLTFAITCFVQLTFYILGGMCECSLSASLKISCPLYENVVLKEWWQEMLIRDEKVHTLGE